MTVSSRIRQSSITAAAVTKPSPTLRGSIAVNVPATSFALTPSTTPVGEVMLCVSFADGTAIDPAAPAITGGGTVTWAQQGEIGNQSAAGANSRKFYLFWGHGTFDGTAITVTPAAGAQIDECEIFLVDWANASVTKPFTHARWTPLPSGNTLSADSYQQLRIGSNNVLGIFAMCGSNGKTHTYSEGTVLGNLNTASVLTVSTGWYNTDFTGYKFTHSWLTNTASSGAFLYEVQASDSDDGPHANVRCITGAFDAAGALSFTFLPKANEVVVFCSCGERSTNPTNDWLSVVGTTSDTYTEITGAAVMVDADHRLMAYAFRYGASPTSTTVTATPTAGGAQVGTAYTVVGLMDEDNTGISGSTNIDWIAQSAVTATATAATSISATVPSVATHSAILGFVGRDALTEDYVFKAGWVTPVANRDDIVGIGGETEAILPIWLGGNEDPSPTVTCSTSDLGIILIEVA